MGLVALAWTVKVSGVRLAGTICSRPFVFKVTAVTCSPPSRVSAFSVNLTVAEGRPPACAMLGAEMPTAAAPAAVSRVRRGMGVLIETPLFDGARGGRARERPGPIFVLRRPPGTGSQLRPVDLCQYPLHKPGRMLELGSCCSTAPWIRR